MPDHESPKSSRVSVRELALVFFRLGTIGFGGPAAHIAMMEEETVKRRKWLTHEQFVDLLGATNLIPGPNSTEMAIHVGYVKAGWLIFGLAILALVVWNLNAAWIILGSACLGWLLSQVPL